MKSESLDKLKGPWRITFDTNPDSCNLRCIMCEENSIYNKDRGKRQNRIMDFNIIQRVIASAAQFGLKEIIPSTMGEPLLYPDFEKLIGIVKEHNLKLNITTNGTFPKLGVEKWAELILPIASDVKISINGATKATAESIMTGLNFENQLLNITKLIEIRNEMRAGKINNPTITFQVTFIEKNLKELEMLLKMAIEKGADRFKGHHLWITWPEVQNESLRRNQESISRWNLVVTELNRIANMNRLDNGRKIVLNNIYKISTLNSESLCPSDWACPFLGREAWIAWDGTFNVCCAPDELRRSLGYFGSVNNNDFMDLWNSDSYKNLINNWGKFSVCKNCNMRRPKGD